MDLGLVVIARALHVLTGVVWTGATLLTAGIIVPVLLRQTTPSPWFAAMSGRIGPMAMGSSILTVITGLYLFAVLHKHDLSAGGIVLAAGALAGLVAVPFGIMIGRVVRTQEAHLTGESGDESQIAAARGRLRFHAQVSAWLLIVSVIAMGAFRYASALAG